MRNTRVSSSASRFTLHVRARFAKITLPSLHLFSDSSELATAGRYHKRYVLQFKAQTRTSTITTSVDLSFREARRSHIR